ncbi:carbohydrate ABC transporter permease [Williamsia sp. CHRR-6]|uniref:carbohydrate ABC transporter permease n=1 Tax=Williamsia sp. CHRR-6 TaxID=2835871 RepID=UPI001BDB017B|nr:sugar ABC transporter permease [Williamsia sp. CHRR-6]MBT0567069.1 sugar ABC transporter permease [Williamsia sp. CHRR-6]
MITVSPARDTTPTARPRPAPDRTARTRRRRTGSLAGLLLAAPFILLLIGTVLVPVGYAIYLSAFTDRLSGLGFGGPRQVFVALGNYATVLTDHDFLRSVGNVCLYALIHVPLMMGSALLLALLLDSAVTRFRQVWSLAMFLPYAVPGVITGLIWAYLYSPGIGPINAISPVDPLSGHGILGSIVNISQWQWMGYNMIIFYTALQTVPKELLEAARVDGAGEIRTALQVKVPLIRPTAFVALVFTIIGSMQLFTEPLILRTFTGAISSTWTPSLYVYESAFVANDYGRAAAASVILALASALLSALVMQLSTRRSR